MNKEQAKQLMCPFQQSETTIIKCITSSCMAWVDDGKVSLEDEPEIIISIGHCRLIDKEPSGWFHP